MLTGCKESKQSYNGQVSVKSSPQKSEDLVINMVKNLLQNKKILLYGAFHIEERFIYGIAKKLGIEKDQLVFLKDYKKNKGVSLKHLQWNPRYAGVMVGPTPHHTQETGNYSSVVSMFQIEEGYPPCQVIQNFSGKIKVSKTAFDIALHKLVSRIIKQQIQNY
jgi:hypothetical protein